MKKLLKIYLQKPELAGIVLLAVLIGLFQVRSQMIFLSAENIRGVLGVLPEVGLVAIGVTLLMICGEFDLSVGSVFALTPMAITLLMNAGVPFWPAFFIGLVVAACVGLANGLITLVFNIPSFITTLGMLFIVRSLTVVLSGGFPPNLPIERMPAQLFVSFIGPEGLFRASFLWFIAIGAAAAFLLSATNLGNWMKATGGFLEASISSGVPARRVKLFSFVLCSVLAGFAGLIQVLRLGAALPSIGDGLELQAVAAAVIGGTALSGGIGNVLGAVVGALLIRVIDNGLVLTQVDANWFKFAVGSLTTFAVVANAWMRRTARHLKVAL
ncbi:MAG: transporter permease [Caballeronia sp.]|uniref:ABC transporter permease n=1 Tax=Caballeronia sp. TaxID=1931223 RepID=UPI00261A5D38|nr:ABC transporter permease [Caballeronia sp.]MDB5834938.1 transporter permease [Caballeronia sp.]